MFVFPHLELERELRRAADKHFEIALDTTPIVFNGLDAVVSIPVQYILTLLKAQR
jgi:hypothetical protein